jgi:(p)ppGpp synthase/HD superfamily hydrolase
MVSLVERASKFAIEAHDSIGQKRNNSDPYWHHPRAVAALVTEVTKDEEMITAAWLHDTVEDTKVTLEQIKQEFG